MPIGLGLIQSKKRIRKREQLEMNIEVLRVWNLKVTNLSAKIVAKLKETHRKPNRKIIRK